MSPETGTWVKVARVEGPWSFYKPEDRVTPKLLETIAKNYNPVHRRAKVVCGYDPITGKAGPSHKMGLFLPSPGTVEEAKFDGEFLHVRIAQNAGHDGKPAVKKLVDMGFDGVSIKWMPTSDLPGAPPYLEHVALISGEVPGTPGIPPLSQAFRALEEWGLAESVPFLPSPPPVLGLDGLLVSNFSRSLAECERSHINPELPDDGQPKEDPMPEFTPEALAAAVERAVTAALKPALDAALKPVNDQLGEVRTLAENAKEAAAAATTAATTATDTARTLSEATTNASLEARIRECVRTGRVRPNEFDGELETARALPAEAREKHLERLEKRAALRTDRGIPYLDTVGEAAPSGLEEYSDASGHVRVAPPQVAEYQRVLNDPEYKADPKPETFSRVAFRLDRQGGAN